MLLNHSPVLRLSPGFMMVSKRPKNIIHELGKINGKIRENFNINEEDWGKICKLQWKSTCSSTWLECNWKNLIRFFITPQQKRYQGTGVCCWRPCGSSLSFSHFLGLFHLDFLLEGDSSKPRIHLWCCHSLSVCHLYTWVTCHSNCGITVIRNNVNGSDCK